MEEVVVPGLPSGLLQQGSFAGSWVEGAGKGKELVGLARLASAPLETLGGGEGSSVGSSEGG